jgi:hypothetical protein
MAEVSEAIRALIAANLGMDEYIQRLKQQGQDALHRETDKWSMVWGVVELMLRRLAVAPNDEMGYLDAARRLLYFAETNMNGDHFDNVDMGGNPSPMEVSIINLSPRVVRLPTPRVVEDLIQERMNINGNGQLAEASAV